MTAARMDSQAISWRLGSCEKTIWEIPNTAMYMVVYTPQSAEWPFLWKQSALYKALFDHPSHQKNKQCVQEIGSDIN